MRARARRPPRQLAADQRQGRGSPRPARQGHFGRKSRSVVDRPHRSRRSPRGKGGKKRVWHSNRAERRAKPETKLKTRRVQTEDCEDRRQIRQTRASRAKSKDAGAAPHEDEAAARHAEEQAQRKSRRPRVPPKSKPPPNFVPLSLATLYDKRAERAGLAARDQIRRLSHRGAARRRRRAIADAQAAELDAPLSAGCRSGCRAPGHDGFARRRNRRRRRRRHQQFFVAADRPERRPHRPLRLLRVRPAASRRPRSDRRAARRTQSGAGAIAGRRPTAKPASSATPTTSTKPGRSFCATPARWGSKASCRSDGARRIAPAAPTISSRPNATAAQEFIVAGYVPATAMPRAIGALIVATHENGELRYAGPRRHRLHAKNGA